MQVRVARILGENDLIPMPANGNNPKKAVPKKDRKKEGDDAAPATKDPKAETEPAAEEPAAEEPAAEAPKAEAAPAAEAPAAEAPKEEGK